MTAMLDDQENEGPRLVAGRIECPEHGRRAPWSVCEHLARAVAEHDVGLDHRLYRIVWVYAGVAGARAEYRLCIPCATWAGLAAEAVDMERATERLAEHMACLCSACGLSKLRPPTQRPLVVETKVTP